MINLPAYVDESDRALLAQADALRRRAYAHELTRADLRKVNRERGVDFATALLYTHFVAKLPANWLTTETDPAAAGKANASVAIVPGAFHREYPHLGADGRAVAELAAARAWRCETIPTKSLGTLAENADVIVRWFDTRTADKPIVVTISKGAADLNVALAARPDLWQRLCGVICISGIPQGTPIANWLLERKRFWLTTRFVLWYWKLSRESLAELRHAGSSQGEGAALGLPCVRSTLGPIDHGREIRDPIQVVGFPLRKHLASWRSRLWHRRFSRQGPNDSVIWLEDLLTQGATVAPIWGADHYMRTPAGATAMLDQLVGWLLAREAASELAGR